jgi:hypothetical protein
MEKWLLEVCENDEEYRSLALTLRDLKEDLMDFFKEGDPTLQDYKVNLDALESKVAVIE